MFTSAYSLVGVEPIPVSTFAFHEFARRNAPAARFVVADARTIDLRDQFAHDAVICTETLERITDDLGSVVRLSPGKRCLCSVPNLP